MEDGISGIKDKIVETDNSIKKIKYKGKNSLHKMSSKPVRHCENINSKNYRTR